MSYRYEPLSLSTVSTLRDYFSFWGWVTLLATVAFAFRVLKSFWYQAWADEWLTIGYVNQFNSLSGYLTEFTLIQPHFPTYYMLLDGWFTLVGSSYETARIFSAAFGMAAIIAIAALGTEVHNRKTGFIAAIALAVNPFHVYLSQAIRMYSLLIFVSILSWFLFFRCNRLRTRQSAMLYGLSALLLGYIHVFGYFLVGAQGLILAGVALRERTVRPLLPTIPIGAGLLPGAALLIYRAFLIPSPDGRGSLESIPHVDGAPGLFDTAAVFTRFLIGRINYLPELIPLFLLVAGVLIGLHSLYSRNRTIATILAAWVIVPIAASGVVSHLVFPLWDWNQARYLVGVMPALLVLFAIGVARLDEIQPNAGKATLLLPVVLLSNPTIWLLRYLLLVA